MEKRNSNLPYIYQNCKGSASQIKKDNRTKGFSDSQLSLSPLNKKCFWLLVRACSQSLFFLCFPVHCYSRKESPTKCGLWWRGFFSSSCSLSLSVSLFACTKLFFLSESYLGNKVFCAATLFELFTSLGICTKAEERKKIAMFLLKLSWRTHFSPGGESCWVCWGALQIPLTR